MPGVLGFPSAKLLGSGLWGKPKTYNPLAPQKRTKIHQSQYNSYIIKTHQRRFWAHHIPIPHHPKKKNTRHVKHLVCPILSSLKDTNIVAKPNLQENTQQVYVIVAPRILYFGVFHLPTLSPQKNIIYHVYKINNPVLRFTSF
jgi:hypothetical protein